MERLVTSTMSGCNLEKKASVLVAMSVVTVLVILAYTVMTPQNVFFSLRQQWEAALLANTSTPLRLPRPQPIMDWNEPLLALVSNSDLPYPTFTTERIRKPSSRVFKEPPRTSADTHLKKILFWNDDYFDKHFGFGFGREPFLAGGCRVNTCTTTGDRGRYPIKEVDAVIWHFRSKDRSLPKTRSPHTRYIFWLQESPVHLFGDLRNYHNVFNWTFTYRLDSDIPQPYDQVFRLQRPPPQRSSRNYAAGKTKLVAWFVSHCKTDSGRERIVAQLNKRVSVDVYGSCGKLRCPRQTTNACYKMLNTTYKFYLSFENSLCRDYITEKFFNILRLDVVPVVYGLGNYSAVAPPHSYIDALSFRSINALADYLLYLHHNDTAYNEYFRWKRFHQMFDAWTLISQQYCALCEKLHSDTTTKVYDLHKWYVGGGHCKNQYSPDIRRFISS